ncbi:hypothetical protein Leryth_004082 [Lithospermum erythrorhizon]|nr:hypothetical protein Leryth_004082 [Lithospermum erythrorhizon]
MAGLELWLQTDRIAPLPPPLAIKKAGRTRRLRRVNPIEAEDNGKVQVCRVRKYLCKICKGQGYNRKVIPEEEENCPRSSRPV